jgi:energy-converting hydrogenase Eha subunit H
LLFENATADILFAWIEIAIGILLTLCLYCLLEQTLAAEQENKIEQERRQAEEIARMISSEERDKVRRLLLIYS